MAVRLQERYRQEAVDDPHTDWRETHLFSTREIISILNEIEAAMSAEAYSDRDCFGVRLALEEAIANALKHGNRNDPSKCVRVRYSVSAERVLAEIEDEGVGFDPALVPDPTLPENLTRCSGRGLFLIRYYCNWVRYNDTGNCLTLCKYASTASRK